MTSSPTWAPEAGRQPGPGTRRHRRFDQGRRVAFVDSSAIKDFVDWTLRLEPGQDLYGVYFKDINDAGGINGRKIEPVFKTYCPIPGEPSSTREGSCTPWPEDDNAFAVMGVFVDFTGDALALRANGAPHRGC